MTTIQGDDVTGNRSALAITISVIPCDVIQCVRAVAPNQSLATRWKLQLVGVDTGIGQLFLWSGYTSLMAVLPVSFTHILKCVVRHPLLLSRQPIPVTPESIILELVSSLRCSGFCKDENLLLSKFDITRLTYICISLVAPFGSMIPSSADFHSKQRGSHGHYPTTLINIT